MSIERWEMLLSSRADRYILKIRGAKADVDKIVASNPRVCQDAQEISDAVFQWVIFVVDANQAERLAIQNQLIAMTADPAVGPQASFDLSEMLTGLSDALENLTNLTAEEQAFVAKKLKEVQERDAAVPPRHPLRPAIAPGNPAAPGKGSAPTAAPPPAVPNGAPANPTVRPAAPTPPISKPPAASPVPPVPPLTPRVPVAGAPPVAPPPPKAPPVGGMPLPPRPAAPTPPVVKSPPEKPVEPMIDHGFASIGGPAPVPPPAPPKTPPAATPPTAPAPPAAIRSDVPTMPGEIVLDIGIDDALPLPVPEAKPSPPRNDLTAILKAPPPGKPAAEPPLGVGIEPMSTTPTTPGPKSPPAPTATPPPLPIPTVPPAPPTPPVAPVAAPPSPVAPPPPTPPPPPVREPKVVVELKTPEDSTFKTAIFFPQGGDAPKQKFLTTIMDMAQKKSKKPMFFHIVHSQATSITSDNAVEWIWTAKAQGADCFFVILPPDILPDFMEGIVAEARQAGLRCFLIPQAEIGSKLLYMDLMVELMLIKRKPKTTS